MWKYVCFFSLICKNISLNTFVQTQIDWHEKIRKNAWYILNLKWRQVWLKSFIACVWNWFNWETWKIIFMSTNLRYNGIAHLNLFYFNAKQIDGYDEISEYDYLIPCHCFLFQEFIIWNGWCNFSHIKWMRHIFRLVLIEK